MTTINLFSSKSEDFNVLKSGRQLSDREIGGLLNEHKKYATALLQLLSLEESQDLLKKHPEFLEII